MVWEGQDWVMGSKTITTTVLGCRLGLELADVGLGCIPLFTPRLREFGPIQAIHSIPTIPMSRH